MNLGSRITAEIILDSHARVAFAAFEMNRQARGPVYVQGLARLPGLITGQPKFSEPAKQVRQRDARFHARQGGAKAEMDAVSECQMEVGVAGDVKMLRVGEDLRIVVGGADHQQNELSRGDHLPVQLDIARRRAHEPLKRRAESQNFLDGRRKQLWRCTKAC